MSNTIKQGVLEMAVHNSGSDSTTPTKSKRLYSVYL